MYGGGAGKQKKSAGYNSDIQNVFYIRRVSCVCGCVRVVGGTRRRYASPRSPLLRSRHRFFFCHIADTLIVFRWRWWG